MRGPVSREGNKGRRLSHSIMVSYETFRSDSNRRCVAMAEAIPENLEKIEREKRAKRGRRNDNVIFVGRKPTMAYVLAVMTQFSDGAKQVHVKARGKSISRAVDVAEVVKNKFMQDLKRQVDIGTEELIREDSSKINVSTIDIVLDK